MTGRQTSELENLSEEFSQQKQSISNIIRENYVSSYDGQT